MIGVIVNTVAVIVGGVVGLLFKAGIPKKITDAVMLGIGLCIIYIGVVGTLKGENPLIAIGSMVIGSIIGTWIDIDKQLTAVGELVGRKFKTSSSNSVSIGEGFVTGSLLFCAGAMTIVGSLNAGLTGDNQMLFTKSMLDFISSAMMSVSLGLGIVFSAVFVLLFQGGIVLAAQLLQPILTSTVIAEITCVGSLLIIALGLNLIGATKIKVANYLPVIFVTPLLCWLATIM